jgi:hypothetical protein
MMNDGFKDLIEKARMSPQNEVKRQKR